MAWITCRCRSGGRWIQSSFFMITLPFVAGGGGAAADSGIEHEGPPGGKSRGLRHHRASSSSADTPTIGRSPGLIKGVVSVVVRTGDLIFPPHLVEPARLL